MEKESQQPFSQFVWVFAIGISTVLVLVLISVLF